MIHIHIPSTDAPDLKLMLLSRSWTQAGINTLKSDPRAIRVLQFVWDKGETTEEEALAQAGRELVSNTTHHIDEVVIQVQSSSSMTT